MADPAPTPSAVAEGPKPRPGVPTVIGQGVVRLTAPNPSMMTGPGTNTYLIGDDELLVIDPGPDDRAHRRRILDVVAGRSVVAVAVTHNHPDHAPGAATLAAAVMAPVFGFAPGRAITPDERLVDGDELACGSHRLRVIHTPGHAAEHCCFFVEGQNLLLTGDHVMEGSTVVIRPPEGDMVAYLSSLALLLSIEPSMRAIAPGHGRVITDPQRAVGDLVAHRLWREERILEALRTGGPSSPEALRSIAYPGLDSPRHEIASVTLWAHLRRLVSLGLVTADGVEPGADEVTTVFSLL